jgi:hypothetical protein
MRYQIWDWETNEKIGVAVSEEEALTVIRNMLAGEASGTINRLGLVDKGAPGEVLTYPLEGAALLAKAFGLEAGE